MSLGLAAPEQAVAGQLLSSYRLPRSYRRQGAEYAVPLIYQPPREADAELLVGSSAENALLRLDLDSGSVIKRIETKGEVQAAPILDGTLIYWGDAAGWLYAYDLSKEIFIWEREVGSAILSAVVLHDSNVLFSTAGDLVYSLNKETGDLNWRYEHRRDPTRVGEFPLLGSPIPLIEDEGDRIIAGFSDGAILALSAEEGEALQSRWIGEGRYPDIIAQPSWVDLGDNNPALMVSGFEGPTALLSTDLEQILWMRDQGAVEAALVEEQRIFLGGSDGVLTAMDTSGAVLWEWDSETDATLNQPIKKGNVLWVSSTSGSLYMISPKNGDLLWSYRPKYVLSGFQSAPVFMGDELVLLSNRGYLYRFSMLY